MFTAFKKTSAAVSAIAVAAMIGVSVAPAEAGPRHRDGWSGGSRHAEAYRHHHRRHGNGNAEAAIVGGLIGLGAALIIGSALAQPTPPRAAPVYGPRPWSNDWYAYCASRYRSFNPRTGYFVTYSGDYAFCR